jgi:hypothetical protein
MTHFLLAVLLGGIGLYVYAHHGAESDYRELCVSLGGVAFEDHDGTDHCVHKDALIDTGAE